MNRHNQVKEQAEDLITLSFKMKNLIERGKVRRAAENLILISESMKLEDEALTTAIHEVTAALDALKS